MKAKYLFILLMWPCIAMAQDSFETYLQSIENHNRSLLAAHELTRVKGLEAKTGMYPDNPEISFDYLTGITEDYSEMVISQSFDFPSSYIYRTRIAQLTSEQAMTQYRLTRLNLFIEASRIYAQMIGTNRKLILYDELDQLVSWLGQDAEKRLDLGEIDILEANRIKTEVARTRSEISLLKLKRASLIQQIELLNGGMSYEISDTAFDPSIPALSSDSVLRQLLASHPYTRYNNYNHEVAVQDIHLKRSEGLPKFEIGYRQDINGGLNYRGIHAGISIPLYENKNAVRLAKANYAYQQEKTKSEQLSMENDLRIMLQEFKIREIALRDLEEVMESLNTPVLLAKSYQAGQLSYSEFFNELGHYLETILYMEDIREVKGSLQLQLQVQLLN